MGNGKWNPEGLTDRMGGKVENGKNEIAVCYLEKNRIFAAAKKPL